MLLTRMMNFPIGNKKYRFVFIVVNCAAMAAQFTTTKQPGGFQSSDFFELGLNYNPYSKPRHGGFTHPGNEDDRCPSYHDVEKISYFVGNFLS